MRLSFALLVATLLLMPAMPATPASADDDVAASVRVWKGYLWEDGEGHLQIGWPVVAMGVMAQPAHVVEFHDADLLAPLVSDVRDSYVFWNYTLEDPIGEALPQLPRVLVQLKGPVHREGTSRTMRPARLLSVEFVDPAWLEHWATVFREPASPWRIREKPPGDKAAQTRALAPKVLAALRKMHAVPGPIADQQALVQRVDERAKVVTTFRQQTERAILRWLLDVNERYEIGLDGLETLGPLPPTTVEVQRWFLASETRAAFLKTVAGAWSGGLDSLSLTHYVEEGASTVWSETSLDVVAGWDEATYAARRALTRKMLGE